MATAKAPAAITLIIVFSPVSLRANHRPWRPSERPSRSGFQLIEMMTLYRSKTETIDAFRYQSDLETMDFKYPYPDWLEGYVVARDEFGLEFSTKFGEVTVRPEASARPWGFE